MSPRRRLADVPWVDPRPAHVIANESLERLAAENLPEQGEILAFYLRLSEILRVFLENRFGIAIKRGLDDRGQETGLRFTAATTEEIESALTDHVELSPEGFKTLMECLGMIDYVVFGGIRPHVGQTEADRRQIRFCVDLNKAPDVTEEPNAEDESPLEVDDRKPDGVPFSGTSENRGSTDSNRNVDRALAVGDCEGRRRAVTWADTTPSLIALYCGLAAFLIWSIGLEVLKGLRRRPFVFILWAQSSCAHTPRLESSFCPSTHLVAVHCSRSLDGGACASSEKLRRNR